LGISLKIGAWQTQRGVCIDLKRNLQIKVCGALRKSKVLLSILDWSSRQQSIPSLGKQAASERPGIQSAHAVRGYGLRAV